MKILVNIARESLDEACDWFACEGVKLAETADGSFDLVMARDLKGAREADAKLAERSEFMRRLIGADASRETDLTKEADHG